MYQLILPLVAFLVSTIGFADAPANLSKRFVPGAQAASITGNWALWHNPAGLAFMGGGESSLQYLYEWSDLGNRHHGGANAALNFWRWFSLGFGLNTQAALLEKSKANLGSDLSGVFGLAAKLGENTGFGISFLKSYNFLFRSATKTLVSFGFQTRPFSFLSVGGFYEEVDGEYFAAPNLVAGISVRPYKEFVTLGIDGRFLPKSKNWEDGFRMHPVFSVKGNFRGYGASVSAEIPGLNSFTKPIFSMMLDINLAHIGFSLAGAVNAAQHNFAMGGSMRTSSEEWASVAQPKDLWVELTIDSDGRLDHKPASFTERLFTTPDDALSVLALLKRLENDQNIGHVVLKLKGFAFGEAKTEEWRDAVNGLRAAGKEVIVYLDNPSERDYYIATAANSIQMNQQASLSLQQLKATLVYFADLLEKIGVKADAIAAGNYKTAPRQWTNNRPNKEEIEVANNILNSFYETMLTDVSAARNITREKLVALFDQGELSATEAKDAGLIDEVVAMVKNDTDDIANARLYFPNYENRVFKQERWHAPKKIVVIPIIDEITDGRAIPGLFSFLFPKTGADDVLDQIDSAKNDPNVAGIIVRIDSPGGESTAGHRIYQGLAEAKKAKPVIASMSDVAASAGYLIAAGTEHILAMPNSITGSIGVFSLMFSGKQLANKVGIFAKELSPIKNPGPTVYRRLSESERTQAKKIVEWSYDNFIDAVSVGVGLSTDEVRERADGRVWLGKEALEKKLIHEIGGFAQAVDRIRQLADIPEENEVTIEVRSPSQTSQFSVTANLAAMFKGSADDTEKLIAPLAAPYVRILDVQRLNGMPQARLPFDIKWDHH